MAALFSCSSNLEEEKNELKSINVFLPLLEMEHLSSFPEAKYYNGSSTRSDLLFISYKDPNTCSLCEVSHLSDWTSIVKKANEVNPVNFIFIFATTKEEHKRIEKYYLSMKYLQSIYLDYNNAFEKCNPKLKNAKYHSFLMDANGKLLYVGDPTKSESNEKNLLNVLKAYAKKGQTTLNESLD